MYGMRRRQALRPGLQAFSLLSVVALLASLCFPLLAQADSSELQYEPKLPSATGHPPVHQKEPTAKSSNNGGASAPHETGGSGKGSAKTGSAEEGSSSPNAGGSKVNGGNGGTGKGNQASSPTGSGNAPVQPNTQASAPASRKSDGGSSPLVPILIAIAALAAVSLGAVLYRQRRQRSGSRSVSPEAS
jgi:cobalamin biosynthesis Mg chelatase CobN